MTENEFKKHLDEGIYNIQDGNYENAIEFITKSIELKNDFAVSYFYRAVAYHALKKLNEAMLDYTKSIKLNPKMTDAYFNRAKIILENNNSDENQVNKAIEDLNKALELDENFIDALFAMAAAHKKLKNYHKSLEYLERLLKLEPEAIHAKALKKLILQKYII